MSDQAAPFSVVYLDNHLLVVDKPPGMLAQADRTGDEDVVSAAQRFLKARFSKPGNVFVGLVHRLDRPASGVMVLARTSKAASRLSEEFRERRSEKRYLAIVNGRLEGKGERTEWLVKGERGSVKRVPKGSTGAKEAVMRWQTLSMEGQTTLVDVHLITGRAHQARVQLAGLGTAILGDLRYGKSSSLADGRAIALHAYCVRVKHPTRDEVMTFQSPPPKEWGGRYALQIRSHLERQVAS